MLQTQVMDNDVIDLTALSPKNTVVEFIETLKNPLKDTDEDGIIDIGMLKGQGAQKNILVKIIPPLHSLAYSQNTVTIKAISSNDENVQDSVFLITKILPKGGNNY